MKIISIVYKNSVLAKVITKVREQGDISTVKSYVATNLSRETTREFHKVKVVHTL